MKIAKNEEKLEKRNRKLEDKYAAMEQFNTMISQVVSIHLNFISGLTTFLRRLVWIYFS